MLYALTGDGLTERQLSDYAGLLKRELGDLDGVARVEIYGEREECIDISILPEKMAMLGVSPAEALATLNGQNNVYYAGYYDNGPDRIRVAVADKFRAVKEIESMVIQGHEDDQLRLCDIARGARLRRNPCATRCPTRGSVRSASPSRRLRAATSSRSGPRWNAVWPSCRPSASLRESPATRFSTSPSGSRMRWGRF